MESQSQKRERVKKIIALLNETHPDAKLALNYSSPLELLVALILAAQARDDLVNSVTTEAFNRYRTAGDWAAEKPERLQSTFSKINFFRRKTAAVQKACQALVDRFNGEVPDNLDDLLVLPGVGRKTANVLLGNAFGRQAIGVDTHVARVSQRLDLTGQTDPDRIEADLTQVVPPKSSVRFCHLLQFHGRRICTAKRPDCPSCSINPLCLYPRKTRASSRKV